VSDRKDISFRSIPKTPPLFVDYVERAATSRKLFPHHYQDPGAFGEVAGSVRYDVDLRRAVVRVLEDQNHRWGAGEATERHLQMLAQPGCYAVVTGQQVGMLTGPCYTLYKALTAIKLARHLQVKGMAAVPVFWMETADHDLDEVDHVTLLDQASQSLVTLNMEFAPECRGRSVGPLLLGEGVAGFLESVRAQFSPGSEFAGQMFDVLGECYSPGSTLSEGFARLLMKWVGEYGLVLLDPLDPRLATLSIPLFRSVLQQSEVLCSRMESASQLIKREGYEPQIKVDPHSTLIFSSEDGVRRLLLREGRRVVPKGAHTEASLAEAVEAIQQAPDRYSPSVSLRPLLQDFLLPTIAYVGGPSEISYFAQLLPLYQDYARPMPVLVPRASLTVLTTRAEKILAKYNLQLEQVLEGEGNLMAKVMEHLMSPDARGQFDHMLSNLNDSLDGLKTEIEKSDPTLGSALETARQKILYQLNHLRTRYVHAEEKRNEQAVQHVQGLLNLLWPRQGLQERELNVCYFLARYGSGFVKRVWDLVDALPAQHRVIVFR
jgi:bacillithiol biosynthesis cysteine-adding enzyme BshC